MNGVGLSIHTLGRSYDSVLQSRKQASQFTWFKPALSKPVTNPKPQDEYLAEDVGGPTLKYAEPYGIGFQPNNGVVELSKPVVAQPWSVWCFYHCWQAKVTQPTPPYSKLTRQSCFDISPEHGKKLFT
ncbi:hypothetical protein HWD31_gp46 [Pantoea phage vB_PagM_SSEM1]|uniref:Uncharacterized protein n=1 Tax=Pantoea phage vB_PagM_SSEM1 TaxID=2721760 RepID=A0A6H0D9R1_9CAUD|nr:hypothetical protein HWD31_gp46 [Pantoea phage vB_PagM_SSEM1]QIS79329.1 hypothetical protein SSEM1_gp46 [Pantoea phage vB_PagM_SSEM1]